MPRIFHARHARALAAALLATAACAGGGRAPRTAEAQDARCAAAFAHADGLLRRGLEQVVADMSRYVAVRDPGADTSAATARVRARADAFAAERAPGFVAGCRGYDDARLRCIEGAEDPRALSACGEEPLVRAFTDEVLPAFTADPLSRVPAP
jgi:hypothetical protein